MAKASSPMTMRIRMMCSDKPAPLAGHQQEAQAVARVDQLGQHDVPERHAEQVTQAVVDVRQRERDEHLHHDLPPRRAERLRRLDVAIRHAGNRADGIRVHEGNAGDEDEHHLLRLVDPEPQNGQRNQRRHRQVASEQRQRRARRLEHAPRAGGDPQRNADQDRETEAEEDALQRGGDALHQRALVEQAGETREHFERTRQHDRRDQPRLHGAERDEPPHQDEERHPTRTEQIAHGAGRGDAKREQPGTITSPLSELLPDRP